MKPPGGLSGDSALSTLEEEDVHFERASGDAVLQLDGELDASGE